LSNHAVPLILYVPSFVSSSSLVCPLPLLLLLFSLFELLSPADPFDVPIILCVTTFVSNFESSNVTTALFSIVSVLPFSNLYGTATTVSLAVSPAFIVIDVSIVLDAASTFFSPFMSLILYPLILNSLGNVSDTDTVTSSFLLFFTSM